MNDGEDDLSNFGQEKIALVRNFSRTILPSPPTSVLGKQAVMPTLVLHNTISGVEEAV
jgi:hypothetical protein